MCPRTLIWIKNECSLKLICVYFNYAFIKTGSMTAPSPCQSNVILWYVPRFNYVPLVMVVCEYEHRETRKNTLQWEVFFQSLYTIYNDWHLVVYWFSLRLVKLMVAKFIQTFMINEVWNPSNFCPRSISWLNFCLHNLIGIWCESSLIWPLKFDINKYFAKPMTARNLSRNNN